MSTRLTVAPGPTPTVLAASTSVGARERRLRRLGLQPSTGDVLARFLDEALPASGAVVLDAGCGRLSALAPFRARIAQLVGVDIRAPEEPLPWLDRFVAADLCRDCEALEAAAFDVVLSSFTIEHFADPGAALSTLAGWLKPGGWMIVTTVNRRNPFVNAYLSLPLAICRPLQRIVKAGEADAHRLVGACNTPDALAAACVAAGFEPPEIVTTDHLARAWGRRLPTFALGLLGDLAFHRLPGRRSTIVARSRRAP